MNLQLDPNKETVLVLANTSSNPHISAYVIAIAKNSWLNENYNVVVYSDKGVNKYKNLKNVILSNTEFLRPIKSAKTSEDKEKAAEKIVDTLLSKIKPKYIINGLVVPILSIDHKVPKKASVNLNAKGQDFHDYVKDIPESEKQIIEKYVEYYVSEKNIFRRLYSFGLVARQQPAVMVKLLLKAAKEYGTKVSYFIIDPAINYRFYDHNNIPAKAFYFEDDKRGSRNFNKFDIAQAQLFAGEKVQNDIFGIPKKTKLFFFAGTLLVNKGDRASLYDRFFKDLSIEHDLYVPLKSNTIAAKQNIPEHQLKKAKENFEYLYTELTNNPHWKGHVLPEKINDVSAQYKYGMVLRCQSIEDSLNFRPITYTYYGILPVLDYKYDPDCLQIPKEIQDKITVKDHTDIEDKIKYFEAHPAEREEILIKLREHFKIDEWIKNPDEMLSKEVKKLIW